MRDYYFNLLPLMSLSVDQRAAVQSSGPIVVLGVGNDKNWALFYRHHNYIMSGRRSVLLVYTRQLRDYYRCCLRSLGNLDAAENVFTVLSWSAHATSCDEILVIDAMDLPIDVLSKLGEYGSVSYSIDDVPKIYMSHGCTFSQLRSLFPTNRELRIVNVFKCSNEILQFAKEAFPCAGIRAEISRGKSGLKPDLYVVKDSLEKDDASRLTIKKIKELVSDFIQVSNNNIAILCPWNSKAVYYRDLLIDEYPDLSFCSPTESSDSCGLKQLHITTFKFAKGLEFDTVIIPDFQYAFDNLTQYHIDWRDFYAGVMCARDRLVLISDRPLPSLTQFVNQYTING